MCGGGGGGGGEELISQKISCKGNLSNKFLQAVVPYKKVVEWRKTILQVSRT